MFETLSVEMFAFNAAARKQNTRINGMQLLKGCIS